MLCQRSGPAAESLAAPFCRLGLFPAFWPDLSCDFFFCLGVFFPLLIWTRRSGVFLKREENIAFSLSAFINSLLGCPGF